MCRAVLELDDGGLQCLGYCMQAIRSVELAGRIAQVIDDRALGYPQNLADLPRCLAIGGPGQTFALPNADMAIIDRIVCRAIIAIADAVT